MEPYITKTMSRVIELTNKLKEEGLDDELRSYISELRDSLINGLYPSELSSNRLSDYIQDVFNLNDYNVLPSISMSTQSHVLNGSKYAIELGTWKHPSMSNNIIYIRNIETNLIYFPESKKFYHERIFKPNTADYRDDIIFNTDRYVLHNLHITKEGIKVPLLVNSALYNIYHLSSYNTLIDHEYTFNSIVREEGKSGGYVYNAIPPQALMIANHIFGHNVHNKIVQEIYYGK